jgi:Spherulation-specific family 4
MSGSGQRVALGVPAYFHPYTCPDEWARLSDSALALGFVVVNVHNGPGAELDPTYLPVLHELHDRGVLLLAYVSTKWGDRPRAELLDDVRVWFARYPVHGVFFDEAATGRNRLKYYAACAQDARAAGAHFVVLNPGTSCHRGYASLADVLVTFEGSWADYTGYTPSRWMESLPASRFCHLVHAVPELDLQMALEQAMARHARTAFFSREAMPHPWGRFSPELSRAAMAGAPTRLNDRQAPLGQDVGDGA